jgi:FkbM family methyltransferase
MKNPVIEFTSWVAKLIPMSIKRSLYRLEPLAQIIRAVLNFFMPKGFREVTVAAGGLAGMQLRLDLRAEKDYWLGTYETDLQTTIKEMVQPGMIAYDVGANIGYISLLLARMVGEEGCVYAFEPFPENLTRLRANLDLNEEGSKIVVIDSAVVDSTGPVRFLVGPSGGMGKVNGSVGRKEFSYSDTISVAGISLDDFIYGAGNPAPQAMKIDIEGGEILAFSGMNKVLNEARPLILLELHGREASKIAWETLTSSGYQICKMQVGYPEVSSRESLDWKAYIVAIPMELN